MKAGTSHLLLFSLALSLGLGGAALGEEVGEEDLYFYNKWEYLEDSLDIHEDLPEVLYGKLAAIIDEGVLRVAMEPYFAPYEFYAPNELGEEVIVGADVELSKLIAERLGVELVLIPLEFTQVLESLKDGTCDLAISALAYTPGRASSVTLSKGYHYSEENAGSCLMIREEDEGEIRGTEDLTDRDIVAQSGSLQEMFLAEKVTQYRVFRRLSSISQVYDFLEEGKADAAMVDRESALAYVERNPDCHLKVLTDTAYVLPEELDGDRVAAKKGALQLMYVVNGVIDEVLSSGQYEQWFDEYGAYAHELGI